MFIDRATPLTEFAWKFRYPGEPEQLTKEESEQALGVARDLFDVVLLHLPEELRP